MITIEEMQINDFNEILSLWKTDKNIGLSSADEKEAINLFLKKNKNLCFIAKKGSEIIGTALCGHDARRGYLYHVFVREEFRNLGLGRTLVEKCLAGLKALGVKKCHLFVFKENLKGAQFWEKINFIKRDDLVVYSKDL
jgi:N-acetylglutamate synthase